MQQYSITLNRAHKIVERLRQHSATLAKDLKARAQPVQVRSRADSGALKRASARQTEWTGLLSQYSTVASAIEQARNAIAEMNSKHGVDTLLAKQNRVNLELTTAKELLENLSFESCVAVEDVPEAVVEYSHYSVATVTSEQHKAFAERIRVLQTELHAVADLVSDANRALVTLTLSDEHAIVVGLKA